MSWLSDSTENPVGQVLIPPQLRPPATTVVLPGGLDDTAQTLSVVDELLVTQLAVRPVADAAYIAPFWFLGIADDGFPTPLVYPDENVSPATQLRQPTMTQILMVGISDDYMQPIPLPEDENPAILLQRWQPVVTKVMVLGVSDDYVPVPPVDDYITVQAIEDWEAQVPRLQGSVETTEYLPVLIVTPPPAGTAGGFQVLLRGLGLAPVQGALADIGASSIVYALVQFDRSYPLGGYPLSPKALGFTTRALTFLPTAQTVERAQGYFPVYDGVNQKVRLFRDLGAGRWVEPFPGTNLSHISMDVAIVGY